MGRAAWVILLIGLLASAVLAAYYQHQANYYRTQVAAAENQVRRERELRHAALKQAPSSPAAPAAKQSGGRADEQAAAKREALIRYLEAALQNKDALIISLQQASTNRPADTARAARRWQSGLDDLKQSNPQRYAAFTNQREQVRQAVQVSVAEKAAYFRDRAPSTLSEADQADYQATSQLLDETWRLSEMLRTDLSAADRRAVMQALHQDRHALEPLLESARSKEFVNLGLQLGYNDDDAQALGEYISKVIDLTSYRTMHAGAPDEHRAPPRAAPPPP